MSTVADPEDPGEHTRTNDVFPIREQPATRLQQKDSDDGQHGVRPTIGAQSGCQGDSLARW
jgi:hypothetical protein